MNAKIAEEHFEYDDGILYWKKPTNRTIKAGSRAGTYRRNGYFMVWCRRKIHLVHRLIWMIHNGDIPAGMLVDHKNQNTSDNRIENLRLCTKSQNAMNQRKTRGTSRFKGVVKNKNGTFTAYIRCNGKGMNLGTFKTEEDAGKAYRDAAQQLFGEFASCGESA